MRNHIHLDLLGGMAGDMFLAAALDSGLIIKSALQEALRMLDLGPVELHLERVKRHGISGSHLHFSNWNPELEHDHRHLSEILEMIERSALPDGVKEHARAMFILLGEAEAAIHDSDLDHVHFHEVGAVDSILDFVGAAWVIDELQASWSVGALPQGYGTIRSAHGILPVPAPATARLLEGFEITAREVEGEMITPTGAAILRYLKPARRVQPGILQGSGYGAGSKEFKGLANVLRMVHYEVAKSSGLETGDWVSQLEAEIDDMSPELLAHVEERLLEAGALDVSRQPVHMKKGRLGTKLTVLCAPSERDRFCEMILRQTTTFGLRFRQCERLKLARRLEEIETPYGKLRVKLGFLGEELLKVVPEYEDCAARAREHGVSIDDVYLAARSAAQAMPIR